MTNPGPVQIPARNAPVAYHVGMNDLPWLARSATSEFQLLHVDLNTGLWVVRSRWQPGVEQETHYHAGQVFAVTLKGRWYYKEKPHMVNTAGSYMYEPAHAEHTIVVPAENEEPTEAWFAIYGCRLNLDGDRNIIGFFDAKQALGMYKPGAIAAITGGAPGDINKLLVFP